MLLMLCSQSTGLVSCRFSKSTMTLGSVPGCSGCAVTLAYTMVLGGLILGRSSSKAFERRSLALFMRGVWKPPLVFSSLACSAPFDSASSFSFVTAFAVPPQEKPFGNSSFAIWHTALGPSDLAAWAQRSRSLSFSMPATDSMSCSLSSAAACMNSPRIFTSRRPSSKEKTPAAQRAVYSPSDRPAHILKRVACSGFSLRNFSRPAKPATYIAGWQ
mmetsp:Transcript_62296/g.122564  ORF Transcript_62296/g.122564 Transcript_62296/m.122564 type:complete len:216 (-) Transcript_62296:173-820(-)